MSAPLPAPLRARRIRRNWLNGLLAVLGGQRCPVCDGQPLPLAASWMHSYLRCRRCHLIWVARLPRQEDLAASYRRVHESDYQVRHKRDWTPWMQHKHATLEALGLPRRAARGQRALDLGCGEGAMLRVLEQRGWCARGLELNPTLARAAADQGLHVTTGSVEEFRPTRTYALITMIHLIEHLRHPVAMLRRVRRWLAPGGLLLLETPMSPDLDNIDHLYCFSAAALCAALERCRLRPRRWLDYVDDNYGHHNLACVAAAR